MHKFGSARREAQIRNRRKHASITLGLSNHLGTTLQSWGHEEIEILLAEFLDLSNRTHLSVESSGWVRVGVVSPQDSVQDFRGVSCHVVTAARGAPLLDPRSFRFHMRKILSSSYFNLDELCISFGHLI
ncbi:hypothetical protein RRG08_032043 [Elysia crispata]|uniref:Uncharacterized protein n=1 Tax=Elysia crispata TaxID=231223 RepID=A0AAE1CMU6_9GAST|nr:hypothetical protein RRG08_032043 [Elysia crispata]